MTLHWFVLVVFFLTYDITPNTAAAGDEDKGIKSGPKAPEVDTIETWSALQTKVDGKCVTLVPIKRMIPTDDEEAIYIPCSAGAMTTYISNDGGETLVANPSTADKYSVYGVKSDVNKLQIIHKGQCSIRTYKTTDGKTTFSIQTVTGAACDAMKKQHLEKSKSWGGITIQPPLQRKSALQRLWSTFQSWLKKLFTSTAGQDSQPVDRK